ncbi:MAG: hypothetical protein AMS15_04055 [Planctomycetes bacterium DG_23]|nr:MAG: hypothetical protein AMS15_04055 [Planctomycetes bacterium DG_23]
MVIRRQIQVSGIVQGVGFRPFIYRLAQERGLGGWVRNDSFGVCIEVEGEEEAIGDFVSEMREGGPPLAQITSLKEREVPLKSERKFVIERSRALDERDILISPDVATCQDCLKEFFDPKNRRYKYPFINCTNCGPRYTIIQDIPYDRPKTTMNKFTMCEECRREYEDPTNRRFHAQPNACWKCGPRLLLLDEKGKELESSDPIYDTVSLLKEGKIVAIKGLGGFHLAVDATNDEAVARLRKRKNREEKPLAVMSGDIRTIEKYALVNKREQAVLEGYQRPILLLRKRPGNALSKLVSPQNDYFGAMLPYTPVHHLLLRDNFLALVMTSGNISEEPICIDNLEATRRLRGIADFFLVHDRDIFLRSDDSVMRIGKDGPRQMRRSRGYIPTPIFLKRPQPEVLALGAELKNTICLTKDDKAFLSQHIGDLKNLEALDFFQKTVGHLKRILQIAPQVLAADLHPLYLSTQFARSQEDLPVIFVQHHHAHIASCLAENAAEGPVIGLSFDGTGYGQDGTIWGGEFLIADLKDFRRVGHLNYVPMPGGDKAVEEPWRMALAHLYAAYGGSLDKKSMDFLERINPEHKTFVLQMIKAGVNCPPTSSLGRLFDAVSALLGICERATFEGQPAMELEGAISKRITDSYDYEIRSEDGQFIVDTRKIIKGVVSDLIGGEEASAIACKFHNTVVNFSLDVCLELREAQGINEVALSGGCFQNEYLSEELVRGLKEKGFVVYEHSQVPPNDGGISLGQAVIAGSLIGTSAPVGAHLGRRIE